MLRRGLEPGEVAITTDITAGDHAAVRAGPALARAARSRCRPTTGPTRPSPTSPRARWRSASSRVPRAAGHLPRRARLRAAHPDRPGRVGVGGPRRGRHGVRPAAGRPARDGLAAAGEGLPRLRRRHREHRRPAGRRARLHDLVGQAGRLHRHGGAGEAARRPIGADGRTSCSTTPSRCCYGGEPVLLDGEWVGYVRAGTYGYTLGASVGLAVVEHEAGVTADWLAGSRLRGRRRRHPGARPRSRCGPSTTPTVCGSAAEALAEVTPTQSACWSC